MRPGVTLLRPRERRSRSRYRPRSRRARERTRDAGRRTGRHGDDFGSHGHELSARLLLAAPAARTDGEGDLITGPSLVLRSAQHLPRHFQCRVIVPRLATATPERSKGIAEERANVSAATSKRNT